MNQQLVLSRQGLKVPGDVSEGGQGFLESPVAPWIGKGAGCSGIVGEHTDPHYGCARGGVLTDKETT